jgi:type IV pilus biogenesis protein CpaD/CtpE
MLKNWVAAQTRLGLCPKPPLILLIKKREVWRHRLQAGTGAAAPLTAVAITLALTLAACDLTPQRSISPDFGLATRHNMAAQIINPAPDDSDAQADHDGRRAGDAWDRYRSGKVTPPVSMSTSDGLITPMPTN